jgi:hypothetical protein
MAINENFSRTCIWKAYEERVAGKKPNNHLNKLKKFSRRTGDKNARVLPNTFLRPGIATSVLRHRIYTTGIKRVAP